MSKTSTWTTQSGLPMLTDPVFIGGVPRSGTTVVGKKLLVRNSQIACTRPAEMWFLTDTGGLCDIATRGSGSGRYRRAQLNAIRRGAVSPLKAFEDRMQGFWYARPWWKDGRDKGLCESISREDLAAALTIFRERFQQDPVLAARLLAADIIDPSIRARGGSRWVDTTPANSKRVDDLIRIFPDLRLVNMIRDGRDVAASIVSRGWGTDDFMAALEQWRELMIANHQAIQRIPPEQVLDVRLEELAGPNGKPVFRSLRNFVGIPGNKKMRRFHRRKINLDKGHVGRWRSDLTASRQREIDGSYQEMLHELGALGVTLPVAA